MNDRLPEPSMEPPYSRREERFDSFYESMSGERAEELALEFIKGNWDWVQKITEAKDFIDWLRAKVEADDEVPDRDR